MKATIFLTSVILGLAMLFGCQTTIPGRQVAPASVESQVREQQPLFQPRVFPITIEAPRFLVPASAGNGFLEAAVVVIPHPRTNLVSLWWGAATNKDNPQSNVVYIAQSRTNAESGAWRTFAIVTNLNLNATATNAPKLFFQVIASNTATMISSPH